MKGNINGDIKALRISKGWTQVQLAKLVGVNRKTVRQWEKGEGLNSSNEELLSHIFGVDLRQKGNTQSNINNMKAPKDDQSPDQHSDGEWYKKTIETLIHQNGNNVQKLNETVEKLHVRDQAEIEDLKKEKSLLWQDKAKAWEHIDNLTAHLQPPQNGQ